MLCKHIAVEIADIRPSKLLEDAERAKSLNQLSSPKGLEYYVYNFPPCLPASFNYTHSLAHSLTHSPPTTHSVTPPSPLTEQSPDAAASSQPSAPLPTYQYDMIQVSSLAGMVPHLQISPQVHTHTHTHTYLDAHE